MTLDELLASYDPHEVIGNLIDTHPLTVRDLMMEAIDRLDAEPAESPSYTPGVIVHAYGHVWRVQRAYTSVLDDGARVALVDIAEPRHGITVSVAELNGHIAAQGRSDGSDSGD